MEARPGSVGTRGGVEWMWGPCACPRPAEITRRIITKPNGIVCHKDKHKAHTLPCIHPLSLQNSNDQDASDLSSFAALRMTGPIVSVNIHQDAGTYITALSYQKSSGQTRNALIRSRRLPYYDDS